jgi:hypothetical protein
MEKITIYFTFSARGIVKFESYYKKIHETVKSLDYVYFDESMDEIKERFYSGSHQERVSEYRKAISCIKKSDIVLLEISTHSLSMGYVLHQALALNKPVVCLYHEDTKAYFVEVIENKNLIIKKYNRENVAYVVKTSLHLAKKKANFY